MRPVRTILRIWPDPEFQRTSVDPNRQQFNERPASRTSWLEDTDPISVISIRPDGYQTAHPSFYDPAEETSISANIPRQFLYKQPSLIRYRSSWPFLRNINWARLSDPSMAQRTYGSDCSEEVRDDQRVWERVRHVHNLYLSIAEDLPPTGQELTSALQAELIGLDCIHVPDFLFATYDMPSAPQQVISTWQESLAQNAAQMKEAWNKVRFVAAYVGFRQQTEDSKADQHLLLDHALWSNTFELALLIFDRKLRHLYYLDVIQDGRDSRARIASALWQDLMARMGYLAAFDLFIIPFSDYGREPLRSLGVHACGLLALKGLVGKSVSDFEEHAPLALRLYLPIFTSSPLLTSTKCFSRHLPL